MSIVKRVTARDFVDEVIESTVPVLVDFYADWCGPCRMLSPALESFAREFAGRVKFVKVNVDDDPGIAGHFGIESIPTLLAFSDRRRVDTLIGIGSPGQLRQVLTRMAEGATPSTVRVS